MYEIKIVAVDDEPDILDLIEATLESDYKVTKASCGEEAFVKIKEVNPDLIILDYTLPDTEGVQICKELRKNPLFIHTPILMLTGRGEIEDKVTGLNSGADDYMVKPFAPDELIARVKMLIRRANINLDANPLTHLPGNITITRELEKRITAKVLFAILYIDIDHFKVINDYYGFERGDKIIKQLGQILLSVTQEEGNSTDFIGHIGGDDFIFITSTQKAEPIAKKIISEFDAFAPQGFDEADRIKGYVETTDRDGTIKKFGFTTISIGITTNQFHEFSHVAEVSAIGAEVKECAKKIPKSSYIFDRRG